MEAHCQVVLDTQGYVQHHPGTSHYTLRVDQDVVPGRDGLVLEGAHVAEVGRLGVKSVQQELCLERLQELMFLGRAGTVPIGSVRGGAFHYCWLALALTKRRARQKGEDSRCVSFWNKLQVFLAEWHEGNCQECQASILNYARRWRPGFSVGYPHYFLGVKDRKKKIGTAKATAATKSTGENTKR